VQYWQIISIFSFLISVTRQFLVSLTSMVVNETRNCLVTDILLNIRKSAEWIKNGKTQLFNSEGVVKWGYFQKKWSIPLMSKSLWFNQFIEMADSFKERSIWSDLICSYTNQCIHSKLIHSVRKHRRVWLILYVNAIFVVLVYYTCIKSISHFLSCWYLEKNCTLGIFISLLYDRNKDYQI